VVPTDEPTSSTGLLSYVPFFSSKVQPSASRAAADKRILQIRGNTTIVDYPDLKTFQMARVASWAIGGVPWKPKQPGQKGLRILSLDGGGTKGVLSIALVKELMQRIGNDRPHEVFDIICGTSTGGIIAGLLGLQMRTIQETEILYDDLIDRIFSKRSNLKLVSEQALYDENEFERILYALCGEELLVDSNRNNCARVFFVSTKVNNNPPLIKLWRNYNYPPDQQSRYTGAFRVNTLTAVRATTAAPTFFTPVNWQSGLYCDGALVANNPTAIAMQEAKVSFSYTVSKKARYDIVDLL
jgi:patatin-like phospholipase/acyl hydrolase